MTDRRDPMTRWYLTGWTPDGELWPCLYSPVSFDSPVDAWTFADQMQEASDGSVTWGVYSLRPVGRVTVREQGGQE